MLIYKSGDLFLTRRSETLRRAGVNNYYASGTSMAERRADQGVRPYKFGGKELDRSYGLDFYDFEARAYDPVLMRFTSVDPLATKYPWISPYAYCGNNPISRIDPDGKDWYMNQSNGELYYNKDFTNKIITYNEQEYIRVGDNSMMGDMGKVTEKAYNFNESSTLANNNNYSIDPIQQLVSEYSYKVKANTGKRSIEYNTGTTEVINEKYALNPQITQQINTKTETLEFQVNQNAVETITGGSHRIKIYRQYYMYNEISKGSKIFGNILSGLFKFGMGTSGSYEDIDVITYKSWNDYSKQTGGKGNLLKYKSK